MKTKVLFFMVVIVCLGFFGCPSPGGGDGDVCSKLNPDVVKCFAAYAQALACGIDEFNGISNYSPITVEVVDAPNMHYRINLMDFECGLTGLVLNGTIDFIFDIADNQTQYNASCTVTNSIFTVLTLDCTINNGTNDIEGVITVDGTLYPVAPYYECDNFTPEAPLATRVTPGTIGNMASTTLNDGNILVAYTNNNNRGKFAVLNSNGLLVQAETDFADTVSDYDSGLVTGRIRATTLSNGLVLLVYTESLIGSGGQGKVVIINPADWSVSSPHAFADHVRFYNIAALANGDAIIAFCDENDSQGKYVIYDASGDSFSTAEIFNDGYVCFIGAIGLDNNKALVAYKDGGNGGNASGVFVIIDTTTNTVSAEHEFYPYVFNASSSLRNNPMLSKVANNVLIAYRDTAYSTDDPGMYVIVNTDDSSVSGPLQYNSEFTFQTINCTLNVTNILLAYKEGGEADHGRYIEVDSSDWGLKRGESVFSNHVVSLISVSQFSDNRVLVIFKDDSLDGAGYLVILE